MKQVLFFMTAVLACGLGTKSGLTHDLSPGLTADGGTVTSVDTSTPSELSLFDGHAHLMPSWDLQTLPSLVEEHGIAGMVLLGTGSTNLLQTHAPLTFLSSAHVAVNAQMESQQDELFQDLMQQLDDGAKGIGEVSIRHFPSGPNATTTPPTAWEFNHPFFIQIFEEARDRGVPVNFHFDYDGDANVDFITNMPTHIQTMSATLPEYPDVRFIWAHAGDTQPKSLQLLLAAHPNLYIDVSSRNPLDSFQRPFPLEDQRLDEPDGSLKESWKELMETYPGRVLFGSDIGPKGRLEQYGEILTYYRGLFNQLTPETAAMIGHQNAMDLYFNGSIGVRPSCDFASDGACGLADLELLYQVGDLMMGVTGPSAHPLLDLDQNDVVDNTDLTQWLSIAASENGHQSPYLRGDTELDRNVDVTDFNALASHFDPMGDGDPQNGPLWNEGNFDGDDDTDITDFNGLASNFAPGGYGAAAIPEPTSVVLLLLGLGCVMFRHSSRTRRWGL